MNNIEETKTTIEEAEIEDEAPKTAEHSDEEKPSFSNEEAEKIVEAVLFAAGHPLSYSKIGDILGRTPSDTKRFCEDMAEKYNESGRPIIMLAFDSVAQLCTREEYAPYIRTALNVRRGGNLSNSSIETLAICAYNQPVTRSYIDRVRGVDSSYAVNSLLERGLIEAVGRVDAPGRPMLYGTTPDFLRCFGLSSIKELPHIEGLPSLPSEQISMELEETKEEEKE